jgi:hypothetical protein
MVDLKEKENILGLMGKSMWDHGSIVREMEKE